MSRSASRIGPDVNDVPIHTFPSKWKTYGFAIVTIFGIGGLIVGGVGMAAYIGALRDIFQIDVIKIMMGVGGGGGGILVLIGILGIVKNQKAIQPSTPQDHSCDGTNGQTTSSVNPMDPTPAKESNVSQTDGVAKTGTISNVQYPDVQRFGQAQWEYYFGEVGEEPPLPDDIEKILDERCPFSEDENAKVKDTHMLVLIPQTVNGKDLTLDLLQELIQKPKNGHKTQFVAYYKTGVHKEFGKTKVENSYWVLMTRDVVQKSLEKNWVEQQSLIDKYEQDYFIPEVLEAATCIVSEYVASGTSRYSHKNTRCEEIMKSTSSHVMVGAFGPNGFKITSLDDKRYTDCGVNALRILD